MDTSLFKARSIESGKWIYGYLFKTEEHTYIAYIQQFDDDLFLAPKNIFVPVNPDTVCVFIGRTDKNGVKIFSNDTVNVTYVDCGEVCTDTVDVSHDISRAGYTPFSWEYSCDGCNCSTYIQEVEVIGNKYNDQ